MAIYLIRRIYFCEQGLPTRVADVVDPIILFFCFGGLAGLLGVELALPRSINEFLTFLLLFTIGLKGGVELEHVAIAELAPKLVAVAALGVVLPLIAFPVIRKVGGFGRVDASALAAHYGSVSVGTFAVAVAFLERAGAFVEPYVATFVVMLEIPAIIVGLLLAKGLSTRVDIGSIVAEIAKSRAIVLLVGGLVIGRLAGAEAMQPYLPFFFELFSGVLALFLLDMGLTVSRQLPQVRAHAPFLIVFGMTMPLVGAALGFALAWVLTLSAGGATILATLGASASYIAVPAAMRASLPEAKLGLCLGASLGVTFPFNVVVGIPLYASFSGAM